VLTKIGQLIPMFFKNRKKLTNTWHDVLHSYLLTTQAFLAKIGMTFRQTFYRNWNILFAKRGFLKSNGSRYN